MNTRWLDNLPPTNTALDYVNRRQQRREWKRTLHRLAVRYLPRFDRSPKANHLVHPRDLIGVVVPPRNPKERGEFDLILRQQAFYDHDDVAS